MIFEGTERHYWVYVPAQYDGKTPACVMVFQDGKGYADEKGAVPRADRVRQPDRQGGDAGDDRDFHQPWHEARCHTWQPDSNRSFRIRHAERSVCAVPAEEMLPEVGKEYKLTDDPEGRAICGISSGGICAFTVAWERPDVFTKVVSHVGSFTNIRGGHIYPTLIRNTGQAQADPSLPAGRSNDLDNVYGNWPLANQAMGAALKFAGYDYKLELATATIPIDMAGRFFLIPCDGFGGTTKRDRS